MRIVFHNRGAALASDFQRLAVERLERLSRFNIPIDWIDVDIRHENNPRFGKNSHRVLLTTHGRAPLMRGEGQGFNDLSAFDEAAEALELQLRKRHERTKDVDRTTLRKLRAVNP